MKLLRSLMPLALLAALASAPALAEYPERPVRLVVPFPAGGPSDTAARIVSQALTKSLGKPVIIENKPGADGAIGAQTVKAATPDGYTLFWGTSGVLALPVIAKPVPFDVVTDFAPVSSVGQFAFGMYVHPGVPSKSLKDFIAHARAHPGQLNYATGNTAEHLAAARFMKAAGVDMVRVPYKGSAQLMPDLIAGRVQVNFGPVGGALQHAREGKIRMLATLLPERTPVTPEVPSMAEAGVPGLVVGTYQMILAPAKTPRPIVDRLVRDVNLALKDAGVRAQLEQLALSVEGSTPEGLATFIQDNNRIWSQFARDAGL